MSQNLDAICRNLQFRGRQKVSANLYADFFIIDAHVYGSRKITAGLPCFLWLLNLLVIQLKFVTTPSHLTRWVVSTSRLTYPTYLRWAQLKSVNFRWMEDTLLKVLTINTQVLSTVRKKTLVIWHMDFAFSCFFFQFVMRMGVPVYNTFKCFSVETGTCDEVVEIVG